MAGSLIRGGLVVDGTGAPAERRDVGIRDGRLVPAEDVEPGAPVVDAGGLVVAPGFVDLHTHYDAQLSWDPTASPSPLHGVTTAIGGNCGFTLAPAGEAHGSYLMRMMARVEGMPLEALEAGLSWDWSSFADWFGRLDGAIGINAGFLVGHSAVRRAVLGDGCHGPATEDQVEAMAAPRRRGVPGRRARASPVPPLRRTTTATGSRCRHGRPPWRSWSPWRRRWASCRGRRSSASSPAASTASPTTNATCSAAMSVAAGRPLNWNVLGVSTLNPTGHESQLAAADHAAARGGRVVALTLPHTMRMRLSFLTGFVLDGLPGWREVLALPVPERCRALADPAVRRRLADGAASPEAGVLGALATWSRFEVVEGFVPETQALEGRTIGSVAAERGGADPFDVLLDVVLADGLRTGLRPFRSDETEADWRLRAEVWRDPRAVIGGSDAGAHLDMMCGAIYSTALLSHGVRDFGVVTLEEAVRYLSDVPARLYGLTGRGRIADGWAADLVLFDADTVGYEAERTRADLPGGASRLYAGSTGVDRVLVNGVAVVADGELTGSLPGTLLHSGRDTETVTP